MLPCFPAAPAKVFQADREAARAAWIADASDDAERDRREQSGFLRYRASAGKLVFHALRHTLVTNLDRAAGREGLSQSVVQELARHKTPAMTARYTHPRLHDKVAALAGLPNVVGGDDDQAAPLRVTGTTDAVGTV